MTRRDIQTLNLSQVGDLIGWAKAEGWNPGLDDAAPFIAADPKGFFGCFVDGRMAAGISAIRYNDRFAFIGLYICHPDFRGQGHGRALWDHALTSLGTRTVGLDGVPAQQENYARMGFVPAYRTIRWSGRVPALTPPSSDLVPVTPDLLPQIAALDAQAFPSQRRGFLDAWLSPPRTALAICVDGAVRGYGALRRCHDGYKIGPLFAEDEEHAETLLTALAMRAGADEVHIDVPENQTVFSARLQRLAFTEGFVTARMYKGTPPRHDRHLVYGVTTLELG